jgi:hypothetical protein
MWHFGTWESNYPSAIEINDGWSALLTIAIIVFCAWLNRDTPDA